MDNGWIKLHRKFTEWEWYHKSEMVHLFLHLLLMANHETGNWQGQQILRGQLVTGRLALSKNTHISQQTIRTCLHQLQQTGEITVKSTNKYSIITLIKYNDYQKDDRKLTNNQPTTNQQLTTNNNNKKNKNTMVSEETEWNFEEELLKLKNGKRKDHKIIALYWKKKNWVFENKEQFNPALVRELKPAKDLIGYTGEQIAQAILYCQKEYKVWTLESVGKRIKDLINTKK